MQTTLSNGSNINAIVFNATIEIANTTKFEFFFLLNKIYMPLIRILSSDSITYILRLIVYYLYPITCDECVRICNEAVYRKPQLNKSIQIRNVSLINISQPINVINLSKYSHILYRNYFI
jgi:hypothetical protein